MATAVLEDVRPVMTDAGSGLPPIEEVELDRGMMDSDVQKTLAEVRAAWQAIERLYHSGYQIELSYRDTIVRTNQFGLSKIGWEIDLALTQADKSSLTAYRVMHNLSTYGVYAASDWLHHPWQFVHTCQEANSAWCQRLRLALVKFDRACQRVLGPEYTFVLAV